MHRRKQALAGSCVLAFSCLSPNAMGGIVFSEDFNGYAGSPLFPDSANDLGNHRTIFGVPNTADGADSDLWLGARFEYPGSGSEPIANDIGVLKYGSGGPFGPYGNPAGRIDDDAGLVVRLDLTGFQDDVELDFDWRTFATESNDRLVVAYYIGGDLGAAGGIYDWFNDPALGNGDMSGSDATGAANTWYLDNWNEVFRDRNNSFQTETGIALPGAGGNVIYLAFWLDNGDHDLAKIDNIVVTATPIPEPGSLALLAIGAGLMARRRRAR